MAIIGPGPAARQCSASGPLTGSSITALGFCLYSSPSGLCAMHALAIAAVWLAIWRDERSLVRMADAADGFGVVR
jgi:hypothetical protein